MYDFNGCIYLDHGDALSLLRESPGKNLVRNIIRENNLTADSYKSYGEFDLGLYGRIDSVIQLMPSLIRVGVEIKCRSEDMLNDHKTIDRYLKSGLCDYYYLVTTSDDMSLMAYQKFRNTPIGVAVLSSGRVLRPANRQILRASGCEQFNDEMLRRSLLPAHSDYLNFYKVDSEIILLC